MTRSALDPRLLRTLGLLLLVGGIAMAIYYLLFFETGAELPRVEILGERIGGGRIESLELVQKRQNRLWLSGVVSLIGVIALLYARNVEREP